MAQGSLALFGLEHPAYVGDCKLIKFLPVRYALTSEERPPLEQENALVKESCYVDVFLTIPPGAPPVFPPYRYTLRALRSGYVHLYFKETNRWQSWACQGKRFTYNGENLSYMAINISLLTVNG